jgi:ABC-type sugar transport system ATPase subunit
MAHVRWNEAAKVYGAVTALEGLTLEAAEGEFLVLVGPSGSGKTTALRLLAGLEALSGGHVWIGDRLVDRLSPRQRQIAMVFQDYALYPQMTVGENLAFGLKIAKVPRRQIDERIETTAATLGLSDLLRRKPRELSGGQRQRVALGRALIRNAQVMLMDEPLSNLDAQLRAQTRAQIRHLHDSIKTTTVYVTHDQIEAMTMGDRIAVMKDGLLQQVGDPTTIYESPTNVFVAGFIGSPAMTLNPFEVDQSPNGVELRSNGFRLRARSLPRDLPAEVVVGVRPEHCEVWSSEAGLIGPFEGRVQTFEALGRETFIGVETASRLQFMLQANGSTRVQIGETITFGVRAGGLYAFAADTGNALARF